MMTNSGKITIGRLVLDLTDGCLVNDRDRRFHLPNKSARVLWALACRPGELVTREMLVDRIWDGNYIIGPTRLNDEIWKIRKALRDTQSDSVMIKTIPRKGYCLLVREPTPETFTPPRAGFNWKRLSAARTVLASLATLAFLASSLMMRTDSVTGTLPTGLSGDSSSASAHSSDMVRYFVDLLDLSDAPAVPGYEQVLKEILREARDNPPQFAQDPAIRSQMLTGLGELHFSLGQFQQATELLTEAADIEEQVYGAGSYEYLHARIKLARVLRASGQREQARDLYETALAEMERFSGNEVDLSRIYNGLGLLEWRTGNYVESEQNFLLALEQVDTAGFGMTEFVAESLENLGFLYHHTDRNADALALYRQALEIRTELFGDTRRASTGRILNNQADILLRLGRHAEARETALASLEAFRRFYPDGHQGLGTVNVTLAEIDMALGEIERAETHLLEGIRILKLQEPGRGMYQLARATMVLGDIQDQLGIRDKAEYYYRLNIAGLQRIFGEDHPETQAAKARLRQYASLD